MQLKNNFFIHSLAGSGKTTRLVKYALRFKNKKIIITTYTNKNLQEIQKKFYEINGFIPANIQIATWFSFLLDECCRPYQKCMGIQHRITNIHFVTSISTKFVKKINVQKYYFDNNNAIYNDKIAEFANNCMSKTNNVINRLESICDYIFIDEAQDLSGYDFELLDRILESNLKIIMVGDSRQNTFNTSPTRKNKKFAQNIYEWFLEKQNKKKGILKFLTKCWRCNSLICNFADNIYPELEKSISKNVIKTGHDGIFYVRKNDFLSYCNQYNPTILVNDVRAKKNVPNMQTLNFGLSKGLTVNRTLIVPTKPIKDYLKKGKILTSKDKFYIAVTRAKYSVAFLIDDEENTTKWHFNAFSLYIP